MTIKPLKLKLNRDDATLCLNGSGTNVATSLWCPRKVSDAPFEKETLQSEEALQSKKESHQQTNMDNYLCSFSLILECV